MKKQLMKSLISLSFLILAGCSNYNKIGEELAPVYQSVVCLNSFYQENNRLPIDNNELIDFSKNKKLELDLNQFSNIKYYLNTDTSYTIEFELKTKSKSTGSLTINLNKTE